MKGGKMYIATPEKKNGYLVGTLFTRKKQINIYYLLNETDARRFRDGVICYDIEGIFEILEFVKKHDGVRI